MAGNYDHILYANQEQADAGRPWYWGDPTKEAAFAKQQRARDDKKKFDRDLAKWDSVQGEFTDRMRRGFQNSSELQAARQQRGVQSQTNQFIRQRGLEGGMGADIFATTQNQLAGAVASAQADFDVQLNSLIQQERSAFIRGEFDFFNRMALIGRQGEIQKDIMQFQQNLQRDQGTWDTWMTALKWGGALALSYFYPAAAPALLGAAAGSESDKG